MSEGAQRVDVDGVRQNTNRLTSRKRMRLEAQHQVLTLPLFGADNRARMMYRSRLCFAALA